MTERKVLVLDAKGNDYLLTAAERMKVEGDIQMFFNEGFDLEKTESIPLLNIVVLIFKRGQLLPVVDGDNGFVPTSRIWKSEDERREWFARYMQIAPNG